MFNTTREYTESFNIYDERATFEWQQLENDGDPIIFRKSSKKSCDTDRNVPIEYERIVNRLDKISSLKMDIEQADREYAKLMRDTEEVMMNCGGELDHRMFKYLMDKIYRQRDEFFSTR